MTILRNGLNINILQTLICLNCGYFAVIMDAKVSGSFYFKITFPLLSAGNMIHSIKQRCRQMEQRADITDTPTQFLC